MLECGTEEAKVYQAPRLTDKQVRAIEYFIAKSPDVSDFVKKVLIWVIRQTQSLTRQVTVSFSREFLGHTAKEIGHGLHDMRSVGGSTHIWAAFQAAGTEMNMTEHGGSWVNQVFSIDAGGYTVWCAYEEYSRNAKILAPPTQKDLDKIDLVKVCRPWER